MNTPLVLRRDMAAGSLVATALLSGISLLTMPEWPDGFPALLATIDEHPTTSLVSALAFVLAQLPFFVAAVAIGGLVVPRKPVLGGIGVACAVLGGFGHSVYGGVAIVQLEMAEDSGHHAVHADLLSGLESSPLVVFMAMGLLGTVVGLVVLAVALWLSHAVPTWIPAALALFVVVEFVGSAVTDWAAYVSATLYLAAFGGLAVAVWQQPRDAGNADAEMVRSQPTGAAPSDSSR